MITNFANQDKTLAISTGLVVFIMLIFFIVTASFIKEAGIDVIRVYEPIDDRAVLDAIAAADMKVITGFGYNQKGKNDLLSGTYIDYVKRYKDHPAVLLWGIGNEMEGFESGDNPAIWSAVNDVAAMVK